MIEPGDVADHGPYDVVLELVGAPSLTDVLPQLAPWARVVVIGVGGGGRMEVDLMQLMTKRARIGGSTLRARSRREKADVAADVAAHVLPVLVAGRVRSRCAAPSQCPRRGGLRSLCRRRQARQGGPRRPMIEAVLFDGDQTLWDFRRVMRDALDGRRGRAARRPARPLHRGAALAGPPGRSSRRRRGEARRVVAARLRVHGFARTLERRRAAEGVAADGDDALAGS